MVAKTTDLFVEQGNDPSGAAQARCDASKCDIEKPQILAELIVEEVSIDGMCGVY